MDLRELTAFINKTSGSPNYQRIEVGDTVIKGGRTGSHLTWDQIWNSGCTVYGKTVCDIGCFNGYFCFKAEEAGAVEVVGYDVNDPAIQVSKKIAEARKSNCQFEVNQFWKPGFFANKSFDIILSSNVLHHVRRQLGIDLYVEAVNDLFKHCNHECLFVVDPRDRDILAHEGAKYGFVVVADSLNHRHGRRVVRMPKWGGTSKIKLGDIRDYTGGYVRHAANWTLEGEIRTLQGAVEKMQREMPHPKWSDVRKNVDQISALVVQEPAKNQPLHMLTLQTYDYLREISLRGMIRDGLSLIRDPLRVIDCYNGIRCEIKLPPISLKEDNRLFQGHFRCRTYLQCGWGGDVELDYLDREEFRDRKL